MKLKCCQSQEKDDDEIGKNVKDPYKLPWKTENIHYENLSMCNGSHSSGYKIYYKDSLLMEECTLGSTLDFDTGTP
jgi:hypothetical protein